MAKKLTDIESKKKAVARAGRCEAYANKVGMMFSETVNSILSLHKSVPELKDGQMFSFDDESVNKQNQVTALLRRLHSNVVTAIRKDMGIEWDKANDEADSMIVRMFGEEVTKNPAFAGWMERNHGALNAFASRSEKGLKLSDRIWRDVKQLREEMEVAMTVSIGEGESASSMSRKVRQYLNDPDLMFRRFSYKKGVDKDGNPVYGMKWKKRVKDEVTGKYRFIDYDKDSYKTGRGVYKSASKNAMRVTRTETNIAYRRADNKRWLNMDFVLGYRIKIAHNHPEKDICDTLQGDYPKDFVFDGWHPQCFCYCTPILIDEEEMVKMMKAKRDGKEYTPKGKEIKDVPANFKKWVEDNADKIDELREKGTEPYFLRHNKGMVDEILNPQQSVQSIKHKRQKTQEQIDDIKKRWEERKAKRLLIKKTAGNILDVSKEYADIDPSPIEKAWKSGNTTELQKATMEVARKISEVKKAEKQFSDIIPNVHKWHKQATINEIKKVHTAIKDKLEGWKVLPLEQQKKKLEFEAYTFLEANMNGVQQKYPNTWEISQDAYVNRLNQVNKAIEISKIKDELSDVAAWLTEHKQSKKVAQLYDDAMAVIEKNESVWMIKKYANDAISEYKKRLAEQARRAAKKTAVKIESMTFEEMSKEEIDRISDEFLRADYDKVDEFLRKQSENAWKSLTKEEKIQLTRYTQTYCYLNESLRGLTYSGLKKKADIDRDLPVMTSALAKCKLEKAMMVRRGTSDYFVRELGVSLMEVKTGDVFVDGGFLSTAVHRDGGFGGSVNMKIIVPKGAMGIYAEPFSHYTDSMKYEVEMGEPVIWDGKKKEMTRSEREWIGQRGSKFKVISNDGFGNIVLQMIGQLW